jgi:hypothetical protein
MGGGVYDARRLGNAAFANNDLDDAIHHYSNAIKADPTNHVLFSNRRYVVLVIFFWPLLLLALCRLSFS